LVILSPLAADKPVLDIAADNPLFETLRRIQTRSASLMPTQAFPQTDRSLVGYLGPQSIRSADSASLLMYLPVQRREWQQWSDSARGHSLFISPAMEAGWRGESHADSNDGATLAGVGGKVYGRLGDRLSFFSRGMVYTEYTDKSQFTHQFSPEMGETYSVEKGAGDSLLMDRSFNRFESYVLAGLPWGITLKAGRDRVHMGPGYFTSLMATRDTPPYWLLEARIDFAPWLSLDNHLLRMTDTDHKIEKYANLHRFEFRPLRSLNIGFNDIVIYQDRGPDPRYFLPLVPLTFVESGIGGPDNSAMGFDFLFAGIRNVSVWGELFIDDLLGPTSFFDDFWENRWAGLAGFQVTSPLHWLDADLVMEYGHVEPWTYNGRQPQTSFKHFNVPSASRLGPDSRTWETQVSLRPWRWLEFRERFQWFDKGRGRSGTLGTIHEDAVDGMTKTHLAENVFSQRIFETSVRVLYGQYLAGSLAWVADAEGSRFSVSTLVTW
ncbi:MAG: capsule assembly Wzi family protein, partial [Fibrobacterota bacterium]|nr:capsule assembly Wzi family protein [Fibrobacterota bacterium]